MLQPRVKPAPQISTVRPLRKIHKGLAVNSLSETTDEVDLLTDQERFTIDPAFETAKRSAYELNEDGFKVAATKA